MQIITFNKNSMKQTSSKAVVTIIIACTAFYAWNHRQPVLTNVQLQNLEAIAAGEDGNCVEWAKQHCYPESAFSHQLSARPYNTCEESTMGGVRECGNISNYEPYIVAVEGECLRCIKRN